MKNPMNRRSFVQLSGVAAGAFALGALGGCSQAPATNQNGKKHHGEGKPHFKQAMNGAKKIDTAPAEEEALAKFVVVSDTHISQGYQPYDDRVKGMLQDVADFCPDCDSIIVNGDITNHGLLEEYETFARIATETGFSYPDDFVLVIGNHDQYDLSEGAAPVSNLSDRFKEQAGISGQLHPYYDRSINGVHLIMLGPDRYPEGNWAHFGISGEEVDWMDGLLDKDAEDGVVSLVFLHEPLYETVRMTDPGDFGHEWSLSEEDNNNLHGHIRKHGNTVFFSGHTHALPDTVQLPGDSPLYVGTGSVAYCIDDVDDDVNGAADISTYGSLGWEVTVWTSCIRFRMRNFLQRKFEDDLGGGIYQF